MVTGLLAFARCAGFVFRAPGFSHPSVPSPLRAGLAVALSIAMAPNATRAPHNVDVVMLVIAILGEFLLGSAIGMAASLIYDAA
ncbi:MAG TPA: flagellar biosynthetic protein FliR, partial [Candidatus Cybelea sp.]